MAAGIGGRDEQPGQPPVRIAPERAVADGGEPGRHEAQPVGPEVDEQRDSVPMWSITLNASDVMNGSVQPNRYGTMIRCPDDEIGRNSVSPCTIPMTSAWTKVSMLDRASSAGADASDGDVD